MVARGGGGGGNSHIDIIIIPIVVCGDFNAYNTVWLCHSHTTDGAFVMLNIFSVITEHRKKAGWIVGDRNR